MCLHEAARGAVDRVVQREEVVAGVRGRLIVPLRVRECDGLPLRELHTLLRGLRGEDGLRVRAEVVRVQLRRVHT